MNVLVKGVYGQSLNHFHASRKLERKERQDGKLRRVSGAAGTPLARVLASAEVSAAKVVAEQVTGTAQGRPNDNEWSVASYCCGAAAGAGVPAGGGVPVVVGVPAGGGVPPAGGTLRRGRMPPMGVFCHLSNCSGVRTAFICVVVSS